MGVRGARNDPSNHDILTMIFYVPRKIFIKLAISTLKYFYDSCQFGEAFLNSILFRKRNSRLNFSAWNMCIENPMNLISIEWCHHEVVQAILCSCLVMKYHLYWWLIEFSKCSGNPYRIGRTFNCWSNAGVPATISLSTSELLSNPLKFKPNLMQIAFGNNIIRNKYKWF